jgi:serine/threonine protein kinase
MSIFENHTGRLPPQFLLQQRYVIVEQAGKGGMGAVYQAVDTRDSHRRVAIKEMSQGHLSDAELAEATAQFQREAALLGRLSHPNLPHIYDAFNERGRSYLVMDFIDGKTLLQLLKESGLRPLPVAQVLGYALQLCDVLAYLHQQHPPIIFRDLKPTNVMVTVDGHVFLIDFGIARIFKEGQEQDTTLLGSPGYAAPEQHGSAQTNPRSDLYSLGATLHCCLTGRDPYHADDRFTFPPVRQYNPQVPVELDQLIQRLVALDERQRPASAVEVGQALVKISQQAAEDTRSIAPPMNPATAPTQYGKLPPGPPQIQYRPPTPNASQAPLELPPTAAVGPSAQPGGRAAPQAIPQKTGISSSFARIWTMPFSALFGLILILTTGGSLYAFNVITGSDHLVEFGMAVLLLLLAFIAGVAMPGPAAKSISLFTGLAALLAGLAFLLQAAPIAQQPLSSTLPSLLQFVVLNQLFTAGLALATIISLLWLTRPFAVVDRIILLLIFGIAGVCTAMQYPGGDGDVSKHLLLLVALITLILGVLVAAQMERVRTSTSGT